MPNHLLTIVIPTYNRVDNLELLLQTLKTELAGLNDSVKVIVSDNASTDGTKMLIENIHADWPSLLLQRHEKNIGAEENFCSCIEMITSDYFWIIGDDDLPKQGVITQLVSLLRECSPALVYMQSEWVKPITGPDQGESISTLSVEMMDACAFARRVHVWFTYISGVVIDRTVLIRALGENMIRRFNGTSLVQLGWVLPVLASNERLAFVNDRCILATKDNSGGYPLLTVFGVRFPQIVHEVLGRESRIGGLLIGGNIAHYLPGLIWGARSATSGSHNDEAPWFAMRQQLGNRLLFWLLLMPLGRFPRWLAQPFYQAWRVVSRLNRVVQGLRGGMPGGGNR
jgi:abequosyltransferase